MTVLIVDDNKLIRLLIRSILTDNGYDVVEAVDGRDAIAKLDCHEIDGIITDIQMPVMDGYEFINLMRCDEDRGGIPVIVISSQPDIAEDHRTDRSFICNWIVKPFRAEDLSKAIHACMEPCNSVLKE